MTDADAVRSVLEGWPSGAGRDAKGWLGTTVGVTDEGQLVAFARFESEEAARANSDRPEQGQWWKSLAANLEGDASFIESSEVDEDIVGDPDTAGFVQVMQGRVSNPQRARELAKQNSGVRPGARTSSARSPSATVTASSSWPSTSGPRPRPWRASRNRRRRRWSPRCRRWALSATAR